MYNCIFIVVEFIIFMLLLWYFERMPVNNFESYIEKHSLPYDHKTYSTLWSQNITPSFLLVLQFTFYIWSFVIVQLLCPTLWDPMHCSTPGFSALRYLQQFAQTHVHWVSDATIQTPILCHPLLLPSICPSIRVFSNESVLHIRWPKYWSFSFHISPSNKYSGLLSFRINWFDLLNFLHWERVWGRIQLFLQMTIQQLLCHLLRCQPYLCCISEIAVLIHWPIYSWSKTTTLF